MGGSSPAQTIEQSNDWGLERCPVTELPLSEAPTCSQRSPNLTPLQSMQVVLCACVGNKKQQSGIASFHIKCKLMFLLRFFYIYKTEQKET